ncbi:hypothetical protein BKA62DRAFT_457029 [Auriculariales sp. MPI-PUGE-AT-0066]|nr:hypothetical protein BKA62DRAFT_457029 [Auriculariales sp. MPI-PUGE-AT-0066]
MQFAVIALVVLTVAPSASPMQLSSRKLSRLLDIRSRHVQPAEIETFSHYALTNSSQPSLDLAPRQQQSPQTASSLLAFALVAALGLFALITGIFLANDFKSAPRPVPAPTPAKAQLAVSVPAPIEKPEEKQAAIAEAAEEVVEDVSESQFVALPPRRPLARTLGAQTLPPHLRLQASSQGTPDMARTVTRRNMLRRQRAERLAKQQLLAAKPALVMPMHPRLGGGVPSLAPLSLSLASSSTPAPALHLAMPAHPRLGTLSISTHPLAPINVSASPTPGPRRRPAALSLAPPPALSLTIVTGA